LANPDFQTCIAKICCNNNRNGRDEHAIASVAKAEFVLLMPDNKAINRSRGVGRIWNGKSIAATRLSRTFAALNDRSLRDVDWDGMLILLSRLMRGLSLER
jgi:hypothetical protein